MAFTYREILENVADAEERLGDANTEIEHDTIMTELEELYVQRDAYDATSVGEDDDRFLDDIRNEGF